MFWLSRTALPKVERDALKARAEHVAGDLESARDTKTRADAGIQAAAGHTALEGSFPEAQAAINAALETAKQAACFAIRRVERSFG